MTTDPGRRGYTSPHTNDERNLVVREARYDRRGRAGREEEAGVGGERDSYQESDRRGRDTEFEEMTSFFLSVLPNNCFRTARLV